MADAIAITVHQLPQSLGERAAKAFDIQRFVDVLCYALQTTSKQTMRFQKKSIVFFNSDSRYKPPSVTRARKT
jgi:hypothetical protein